MSMFKTAVLTVGALVMVSGVASAAPGKHRFDRDRGGVSPYERVQIQQARSNLASIKARAWRDGKLSFVERFQIANAERRLNALVARAHRS